VTPDTDPYDPRMNKVPYLVTGAGGFVGSHVVRELLEAGYAVRGMVRNPDQQDAVRQAGAEPVLADLRDPDALGRAVRGVAGVFHIAALFRQADSPDSVYYDINAEGTRRVFEAAVAAGVPRVITCSTSGVLGHIAKLPADESTPYNPDDVYQRSKMEGEKIALDFYRSGRMGGVVIRPAMVYGPGDTRFLKMFHMIARRRFFYVGRGDNLVHFIDVRDLARAFRLAMERRERNGEVYIIVGGRSVTLHEAATLIARELGVSPPWLKLPVKPMQWLGSLCEGICLPLKISPPLYRRRVDFYTKSRSYDGRKARGELGFEPCLTLEQEIHDIVTDYRQRGWL
jgi:nucleoside-diphosphate-sugar epimerase